MSNTNTSVNSDREDLPVWMRTIDEETFYNSDPPTPTDDEPTTNASSKANAPSSDVPEPASPSDAVETDPESPHPLKETSSDSSSSDPTSGLATADPSESTEAEFSEMPLQRKLSLSTTDPSELPEPTPDLQPADLGYVRGDLNKQLEKAVSVLKTRYGEDFSKSLFLDVALRQILTDLHTHGKDSTLVLWLDSILHDR